MSKEQIVGNEIFKSKKALEDHVRLILKDIHNNNKGIIYNRHEYFEFLINLIKRHKDSIEKIGKGVEYFKVVLPLLSSTKGGLQLRIKQINLEDEITCSWRHCISQKSESNMSALKSAMRNTIRPQIIEFRDKLINEGIFHCCKCGNSINVEIDHNSDLNLSFAKISGDFIENNKDNLPIKFKDNSDDYDKRKEFLEKDINFKNNWYEYHKEKCSLRALCDNCNGSNKKQKKIYEQKCLIDI